MQPTRDGATSDAAASSTYTVAAIEDGDDDAWRKLLSDADFLAAVEESEDLAAAFVRRMDQQTVEISRLGVPEGNDPEIWTYAAHLFSHEDPAVLATARVAVWPRVEIKFQAPHDVGRNGAEVHGGALALISTQVSATP